MKLVVAVIRPEKLNAVLEELYRSDIQGLTISRVQGHGGEREHVETYRGLTVKMELSEKVRLEVGVSNHFVEPTVRAILKGARTGAVGAMLTGVFADPAWNPAGSGLIAGNPGQLGAQFITVLVVAGYSATMTFALLKLLALVMPLRVAAGDEGIGLDVTQHGEEAYARGDGAILVLPDRDPPARAAE